MSFLERVDQSIRRSVVWRSLFRQPYPRDERSRAYAVMNNVFLHIHPVRVRQHAVKFAYTFCLGGLSFFLFLVLTITGVYLMFFYVPSATLAYTNILDIQSQVTFGLLTRNIHRWAAHLMVFFVFLHMMRVFYHGAYKPPREFNWVIGVVLLLLTLLLSFTGYLLPWDQLSDASRAKTRKGVMEGLAMLETLGYRSSDDPYTTWLHFRRCGEVTAVRRDEPWTWTTSDGTAMRGQAGDWEVTGDEGAARSVDAAIFDQTHEPIEGAGWNGFPRRSTRTTHQVPRLPRLGRTEREESIVRFGNQWRQAN